jgi:hypothetical protein
MEHPNHGAFAHALATSPASRCGRRLTATERQIVAIGLRDPLSSIARPDRLTLATWRLFGFRPANKLADPKLEALRRYAVVARRSPERIGLERVELGLLGYSDSQIEEAQHLVDDVGEARRRRGWITLVAALCLAGVWLAYSRVQDLLEDRIVSMIVIAVFGLPLFAMLSRGGGMHGRTA